MRPCLRGLVWQRLYERPGRCPQSRGYYAVGTGHRYRSLAQRPSIFEVAVMIHMLSRFDLKPDVSFDSFRVSYCEFIGQMRAKGLVEATGKIGRRELDTPMDTDEKQAPEYYVIMSFRDRRQLDEAYAYLATANMQNATAHGAIYHSVFNSVFTCWRDLD